MGLVFPRGSLCGAQDLGRLGMTLGLGQVERRAALVVLGRRDGAAFEEESDDGKVSVFRCLMKGGVASVFGRVGIGAGIEQSPRHLGAPAG